MKGSRGKLPKTRLTKKAGSVKSNKGVSFRFAKGSTHIFKIYGPNIGDLQSLIIEVPSGGLRLTHALIVENIDGHK